MNLNARTRKVWQAYSFEELRTSFSMAYIQGEGRSQGTLFPVVLDDFVPTDHVCRVIDAFVDRLSMSELGFERAQAAETGRPGYDPRDLLKLICTATSIRSDLHDVWRLSAVETSN